MYNNKKRLDNSISLGRAHFSLSTVPNIQLYHLFGDYNAQFMQGKLRFSTFLNFSSSYSSLNLTPTTWNLLLLMISCKNIIIPHLGMKTYAHTHTAIMCLFEFSQAAIAHSGTKERKNIFLSSRFFFQFHAPISLKIYKRKIIKEKKSFNLYCMAWGSDSRKKK